MAVATSPGKKKASTHRAPHLARLAYARRLVAAAWTARCVWGAGARECMSSSASSLFVGAWAAPDMNVPMGESVAQHYCIRAFAFFPGLQATTSVPSAVPRDISMYKQGLYLVEGLGRVCVAFLPACVGSAASVLPACSSVPRTNAEDTKPNRPKFNDGVLWIPRSVRPEWTWTL